MGTFLPSFIRITQFLIRAHKYTLRKQAKPYVSPFPSENQPKWRLLPCLNNGHLQLSPTIDLRPPMINFSHLMNLRTLPTGYSYLQIPFYTCTTCMVYTDFVRHCHRHYYYTFYKSCPSRNKNKNSSTTAL
jgi:hypothetical protein